jgi:hypothetical protein
MIGLLEPREVGVKEVVKQQERLRCLACVEGRGVSVCQHGSEWLKRGVYAAYPREDSRGIYGSHGWLDSP